MRVEVRGYRSRLVGRTCVDELAGSAGVTCRLRTSVQPAKSASPDGQLSKQTATKS